MGQKGKPEQYGLTEFIVDKWEGGKKTIVYVTDAVAKEIEKRGLNIQISREAIRRVVKTHEEEIQDAKRSMEIAKNMAEIFQNNKGTEITEAALMQLSSLVARDIRQVDSLEFDNPESMINSAAKLADAQLKLSSYRTKAVSELEKAKDALKEELRKAVQSDPELLNKLITIVDKANLK